VGFEWDPNKAKENFRKHGVHFDEAEPVFEDPYTFAMSDDESDPREQRFVAIGLGARLRILVVAYCYRGDNIRIISARPARPLEREGYERQQP
jgi:uncharacterized protein